MSLLVAHVETVEMEALHNTENQAEVQRRTRLPKIRPRTMYKGLHKMGDKGPPPRFSILSLSCMTDGGRIVIKFDLTKRYMAKFPGYRFGWFIA